MNIKEKIIQTPLIVWFLIPTVLIVIFGVIFFTATDFGNKKESDNPDPVRKAVEGTVEYEIVSRTHITAGTSGSGYNSNPPTSGPHWPASVKNGVFDKQQLDEQLIHNLEHGYIWISYLPTQSQLEATNAAAVAGLTEDEVKQLEEIVREDSWKIVLEPRIKNDHKIALVAWGRLLTLDTVDVDKIKDFIKTYRNRAPEKTPD